MSVSTILFIKTFCEILKFIRIKNLYMCLTKLCEIVLEITLKGIGVYSLLLIFFGFMSNIIFFMICIQKNLFLKRIFIFIAFHSISNCLSLLTWNMDHFITAFFDITYKNNRYTCKIFEFLQYVSLQTSSWALVGA